MKLQILPLGLVVALLAAACSNRSKLYPGFSETSTGIHYQLIALGPGAVKPDTGEYITVDIAYRTAGDSLFFHGTRQFLLAQPEYPGAIDECFRMLTVGDSGAFYIKAKPFFEQTLEVGMPRFIGPDDYMRVDMTLLERQTRAEFDRQMEAFASWIEDFGDYERVVIKQYMAGQQLDVKPTASGIYIIRQVQKPEARAVHLGDTISVHFEGRFFNGKIFDSTRKRDEPFIFVYGDKWQVIPGIEEALGQMRQGERVLLIIPSEMAFGQGGNSNGIVPAFTSVVFEVELLSVIPGTGQAPQS